MIRSAHKLMDLSRIDIFTTVPVSLTALVLDVFAVLPEPPGKQFVEQIKRALANRPELAQVPAQYLNWLLMDSERGLVNLSRRADVREALQQVSVRILQPLIDGYEPDDKSLRLAMLTAHVAQMKAWHVYQEADHQNALQERIEWMIATAAADSLRPEVPEQLVGSTHSAAVAWAAAAPSNPGAAIAFYLAIRDQLLTLLGQWVAPVNSYVVGDRVAFDDPKHGAGTGTVLDVIDDDRLDGLAVVLVDHTLPGIVYSISPSRLTLQQQVAA